MDVLVDYVLGEFDSYKYLKFERDTVDPTATITIEQANTVDDIQAAIQIELDKSKISTVVVTGSKPDADSSMALAIPAEKTLRWSAEYAAAGEFASSTDALIQLTDSSTGTFGVEEEGLLDGSTNRTINSLSDSTEIVVKGTVKNAVPGKIVLNNWREVLKLKSKQKP